MCGAFVCDIPSRVCCVCVLCAPAVIIAYSGLVPNYVDPLTHLAMLLVAAVHDFGHVGRTNDFLVRRGVAHRVDQRRVVLRGLTMFW